MLRIVLVALILLFPGATFVEAGLVLTQTDGLDTSQGQQYATVCDEDFRSNGGLLMAPNACRTIEVTGMSVGERQTFLGVVTSYNTIEEAENYLDASNVDYTTPVPTPAQTVTNTSAGSGSQSGGLVSCSGDVGDECQVCSVVELINNVVDWLVGVLAIIAAIMFAYAGFKLVISGGNQSAKQEAKSMITNVIIGLVIVLAAWLLIDLLIRSLAGGSVSGSLPWNQIDCVGQPRAEAVTNPIEIVLVKEGWVNNGGVIQAECEAIGIGSSGNLDYDCSKAATQCGGLAGGNYIISNDGSTVSCGANPADLSAAGACDASLVRKYFPNSLGDAQCIIRDESACGGSMVSRSDVMRNDGNRAFSFGPMQINLTVHELEGCGPGGATLDCKSAFRGKNYSAVVTNEQLYQDCARAAQDVDCNLSNGKRLRDRRGNWNDWSTAKGCGLR